LAQVKHYFINSHSITDEMNAGRFEQYALAAVQEIFGLNNIAVMVGGTGLYIRAFCEGMDAIPGIDISIREQVVTGYQKNGLAWLQDQVREKDPEWFAVGEIQNPQRIMRALEIVLGTGRSLLSFHAASKTERDFNIIKIGLNLPRQQLYDRINARTDEMIAAGLVDEVKTLRSYQALNALQTVGYSEIFSYLDGAITLDKAIELVKRNTRHYAKRQLTWFLKDQSYQWFSPVDYNQLILNLINLV